MAKKGEVAGGEKKWPVTAFFSNQEVDKYLYCAGSGQLGTSGPAEGDPWGLGQIAPTTHI